MHVGERTRTHVFASVQIHERARDVCVTYVWIERERQAASSSMLKRVNAGMCAFLFYRCVWFCVCIRGYSVRFCFPFTILIKTLFVRIAVYSWRKNKKKKTYFVHTTEDQRRHIEVNGKNIFFCSSSLSCWESLSKTVFFHSNARVMPKETTSRERMWSEKAFSWILTKSKLSQITLQVRQCDN